MAKFTFDDEWFGTTSDNKKVDYKISKRPSGSKKEEWYRFAGMLANHFNGSDQPLGNDENDFAQLLLEAVQDLGLMQRIADYARGCHRTADEGWFEQELEKFRKAIY